MTRANDWACPSIVGNSGDPNEFCPAAGGFNDSEKHIIPVHTFALLGDVAQAMHEEATNRVEFVVFGETASSSSLISST